MRSNATSTPNGNPPPPRRQLRFKGEGTAESEDDLAKLVMTSIKIIIFYPDSNNFTIVNGGTKSITDLEFE